MSSIKPRTVSVSVEINDTDWPLNDIKAQVRTSLEVEGIGRIRTIQANVMQGSRKAKKAAKRR